MTVGPERPVYDRRDQTQKPPPRRQTTHGLSIPLSRKFNACRPRRRDYVCPPLIAGWSSLVARQAHNLKVAGSNPAPATTLRLSELSEVFLFGTNGEQR